MSNNLSSERTLDWKTNQSVSFSQKYTKLIKSSYRCMHAHVHTHTQNFIRSTGSLATQFLVKINFHDTIMNEENSRVREGV